MEKPSKETIEQNLGLNRKKSYKKYIWIALFLSVLALLFFYFSKKQQSETLKYESAHVEKKTITTTVLATGNMEPTNSVDVGIEVSGTISEVLVDYNQKVRAGEVLAKLDTTKLSSRVTSYQAGLLKLEAAIAEATATKNKSENEWHRVQKMVEATDGNYPSKQEADSAFASFELSKAALESAKAGRNQAIAELKSAQDDLKKAVIVSPIDGIVLEKKVESGQTVAASMTTPILFKLAKDLTKMRVILSVDEADMAEVKEGQKVKFSVDAHPQKLFDGVLTQLRLNSQKVNGVVTYDAVVSVENRELLLRPGMTVSAQIITKTLQNVLSIPNAALRFAPPLKKGEKEKGSTKDLTQHVWVLVGEKPTKVEVKTAQSDGSFTVVEKTTLKEGDAVLVGIKKDE